MRHVPIAALALILLAATVCSAGSSAGAVAARGIASGTLYACEYRPDAFPFAGTIVAHLSNASKSPLNITDLLLDGESVGKVWPSDASFLDPAVRGEYVQVKNNLVAWYRAWPNPLPPGQLGEVVVRLSPKACQARSRVLTIALERGATLTVDVPLQPAPYWLNYIGIEPDLQTLHIYAERRAATKPELGEDTVRVELDGREVTAAIERVSSRHVYCQVQLRRPWTKASTHVVALRAGVCRAAATIRAFGAPPPLGIMGNLSAAEAQQYYNHLFDCHIAFVPGRDSLFDNLEPRGLLGCYLYYRRLNPGEKKHEPVFYDQADVIRRDMDRESLWGYFLEDEPDGRYHVTALSGLAIARDVERARSFCSVVDPSRPIYLQIDHGGFPRGLYNYGLVPDYICTHAYRVGTDQVVNSTRYHVDHQRQSSRPRPFYYLNCGYSTNGTRDFEPEEMQLEVYTALAAGAKSFQWYPAHGGRGLLKHPRMWNAVGRMNGVLHQVLPLAAIGAPVGEPRISAEGISGSTILCGDRAVVVALVNETFSASKDRFELTARKGVQVRVRVPRSMKVAGGCVVGFPEAPRELAVCTQGSRASFTLDINAGAAVVLYADPAARGELARAHAKALARFESMPEE